MNEHIIQIPVSQLKPMVGQPRTHFSQQALTELAQSIQSLGVIQPVVVTQNTELFGTPTSEALYTIIAGERRWRAAQMAGLQTIPCVVRTVPKENQLEMALVENLQRENLSPVEEAKAMRQLMQDYHYTHETLSQRLGKERSTVSNTLRLLRLPEPIQKDLENQKISLGHAKILCGLPDPELQKRLHQTILTKHLSVRQTEDTVKRLRDQEGKNPDGPAEPENSALRFLRDQFQGHLGTKVRITGDSTAGKIEIFYFSLEDLERIAEVLVGNPILTRKPTGVS